jgi:hypothetical protein
MKLRRAAALCLLVIAGCAPIANTVSTGGWLLLVPPLTTSGNADTGQPLSKWQSVGNFGSQIDCNTSMTNQQFTAHGQFGPITNAQTPYQAQAVRILNGQCVSIDDPRLKEK